MRLQGAGTTPKWRPRQEGAGTEGFSSLSSVKRLNDRGKGATGADHQIERSGPDELLGLCNLDTPKFRPSIQIVPGKFALLDKIQLIENWLGVVIDHQNEAFSGF